MVNSILIYLWIHCVRLPFDIRKSIRLCVSNETLEDFDAGSKGLRIGEKAFTEASDGETGLHLLLPDNTEISADTIADSGLKGLHIYGDGSLKSGSAEDRVGQKLAGCDNNYRRGQGQAEFFQTLFSVIHSEPPLYDSH